MATNIASLLFGVFLKLSLKRGPENLNVPAS